MTKRVSAAEARDHFSELLDQVRDEKTTFVIVQGEREVGQLAPVSPAEPMTLRKLVELVQEFGEVDPDFADDLEEIQAQQSLLPGSPWPS